MLDRWIIDCEPSERYPIYTRANAGEVYPDPVSPLSATVQFLVGGESGWRDSYLRYTMHEHEFDLTRPEILGCFGGYVYLNMSLTRIFGARMPGMTPEQVDMQYFGEMPGIPPYVEQDWHTDEERSAAMGAWVQEFLAQTELPELLEDRATVDALVDGRPNLRALTDRQLVDHLRSMIPLYRPLFDRHITISAATGFGIGMVGGVLAAVGEPELTMAMFSGMGDVDSAAPSYAMWDMAKLAAGSAVVTAEFDAGVDGLLRRLGESADADAKRFCAAADDFISRFGSRGPNEWELRSHTWGTKPELWLAAVDRMRNTPDDDAPSNRNAQRAADYEKESARIIEQLQGNDEALGNFVAGLNGGRVHLQGRERTKTTIIKLVHEMRLAALELGRRGCEAGTLRDERQIFMLKDDELDEWILYPAAWTDVLAHREEGYLELFDLEPPFIVDGVVPPLSDWSRRDRTATKSVGGDVLTGIGGCSGTYTGRARVVLDPGDPFALEPGDVLVAPITDPAWTPLFVPAGAVVVDVGAQISHAIIVSRELGIPCVVSVTDATKKIPDGATITVDGTLGTVTIHD